MANKASGESEGMPGIRRSPTARGSHTVQSLLGHGRMLLYPKCGGQPFECLNIGRDHN